MAKIYAVLVGAIVLLAVPVQWFFGTVYNDTVRHWADIPAMLFIVPGLLLKYGLHVNMRFDNTHQGAMVWISALVNAAVLVTLAWSVHKLKTRKQV